MGFAQDTALGTILFILDFYTCITGCDIGGTLPGGPVDPGGTWPAAAAAAAFAMAASE